MKRGFTLIELLIVIGVLAILATVTILVLNPAEILAQARDSQRLSDLSSVKSAIALYLATYNSPVLTPGPFSSNTAACYSLVGTCVERALYGISGSGWVAVDLTNTSGGSPLSALPKDPTDTATYHYAYDSDNTAKTFELNSDLESAKYQPMRGTDGGNSATVFEIGTDPGLDL